MIDTLHKEYSILIHKTLKCLNIYSSLQTSPLELGDFEFSLVDIQICDTDEQLVPVKS